MKTTLKINLEKKLMYNYKLASFNFKTNRITRLKYETRNLKNFICLIYIINKIKEVSAK